MDPQITEDVRSPQGSRMPLKLYLAVAGILFVAAAALVLWQGREETTSSPPAKPAAQPGIQSVQVMKPLRRTMSHVLALPANVSPWYQATIYAKVPGYLKWIGVDKGDRVKHGQLLAVIDAPEIRDQFEQAQSDHAIKKLTFDRLEAVWKANPDVIAKQDVDVAEAAAESAKHLLESRRALLEYTKVTAPFSGIVTARFVDPGAMIQAATGSASGAVPLVTIMDMDTVRIYVSVPQEAARLATPGVPAVLTMNEVPGMEVKGSITRTTGALDPATRTLLVEIDLPNKEHRIKPGSFVNVSLQLQEHTNVLALPPGAIVPGKNGGQKSVFVVEKNEVRSVPITTGIDDGLFVEIVKGLSGTEDVVVVGKGALTPGDTVKATAYSLPAGKPSSQHM
jgi:membrane fusion protein (multidrug efflux system)